MTVDERARAGLFLAMQYPVEIPGVTVTNFLRTAKTAIDGEALRHPSETWTKDGQARSMKNLRMDPEFAQARNVNEGFSGGEKKRHEILPQLPSCCKPKIAILDETDSGLDVDDALKIVSEGVPTGAKARQTNPASACC